jgi:hypothetical protein
MADRLHAHERSTWDSELAEHLLTAFDREDVLAECHCLECNERLVIEPRRRQRTLNVTIIEETALRCRQCTFTAMLIYRELGDHNRTVMIDGRVIREEHVAAPSPA